MKLTKEGCRGRQEKLVAILQEKNLDGVLISDRPHVYYFTGCLCNRHHSAALLLNSEGKATLVSSGEPDGLSIDTHLHYDADHLATMHSRQHETVADTLKPAIRSGRYGADMGSGIACIAALGGHDLVDLSPEIVRMRKAKWPDEVDAIRDAIRLTDVMYETALEIVRPGADEMDVYSELLAQTTRAAGEFLEVFGNDFQANALGGLPRRRRMEAGELYILDSGPRLHGYSADNCRTFAVDGSPTDAQLKAWQRIDSLFAILEDAIRPGVDPKDLFKLADTYLCWEGFPGMIHHLGHGIGLRAHEGPELNPHYDTVFEQGDVITLEPGLYKEELKAGMRLEENYLVTADGVEKLTSFPRHLIDEGNATTPQAW
jgi:Xaa-Pro aminopeptidase